MMIIQPKYRCSVHGPTPHVIIFTFVLEEGEETVKTIYCAQCLSDLIGKHQENLIGKEVTPEEDSSEPIETGEKDVE